MTPTPTGAAELPEALLHASYLESVFISEEMSSSRANRIATCLRRLHAQVEALSAAQAEVPAGYVLVPKEPTTEMMVAAEREGWTYRSTYLAMLAAAPQPSLSPAPAQPERHYGPLRDADAEYGKKLSVYSDTAPAQPGQEGEHSFLFDEIPSKDEKWREDYARACHDADLAARAAPQPAVVTEPFGWVKGSEIESSKAFGGSINLWRRKYDCDTPVYLAPQPATADAVDAVDAALSETIPVTSITLLRWRNLATANPQDLILRIDAALTAQRINAYLAAQREVKP